MPKRIVDGDALWTSDKIAEIEPPKYRAEIANLIPLMLANGTFECSARIVWRTVYAANRSEYAVQDVETLLAELERVKILFRWRHEDGKTWGYFVGVDKKGRLPSPSREKEERAGVPVPKDQLSEFLGLPTATLTVPYVPATGGQTQPYAGNGSGSGLGSGPGIGIGNGSGVTRQKAEAQSQTQPEAQSKAQAESQSESQPDLYKFSEQRKKQHNQPASPLAIQLAKLFHQKVAKRSSPPANWEYLWSQDMEVLLARYTYEDSVRLIERSQTGRWATYIIRAQALVNNAEKLAKQCSILPRPVQEEPEEEDLCSAGGLDQPTADSGIWATSDNEQPDYEDGGEKSEEDSGIFTSTKFEIDDSDDDI